MVVLRVIVTCQHSLNLLRPIKNHLVEVVIVEEEVVEVHVVGGVVVKEADEEEGAEENVVVEMMITFNRILQRQQILMTLSSSKFDLIRNN